MTDIDPSYWEPPDDPEAEDRFFDAFADAVRKAPARVRCGGSGELIESTTPHLDHRDPAHCTREFECPGCPDCEPFAWPDALAENVAPQGQKDPS